MAESDFERQMEQRANELRQQAKQEQAEKLERDRQHAIETQRKTELREARIEDLIHKLTVLFDVAAKHHKQPDITVKQFEEREEQIVPGAFTRLVNKVVRYDPPQRTVMKKVEIEPLEGYVLERKEHWVSSTLYGEPIGGSAFSGHSGIGILPGAKLVYFYDHITSRGREIERVVDVEEIVPHTEWPGWQPPPDFIDEDWDARILDWGSSTTRVITNTVTPIGV